MKFKVNGVELDATHMRVREICEAEKALQIDMGEAGFGGKVAVSLFVGMRRAEPKKPAHLIADAVMSVDIEQFADQDEEADVSPPADTPAAANGEANEQARESLRTSGPQRSEVSA